MSYGKTEEQIFVTGADGFIGSHLTEALVRKGYKVRAFAQYNSFNSWGWLEDCSFDVKDEIEIITGDIRDPNGVKRAMQGCSKVIHLAALIGIPFSYHSPDLYVETNIKGTLNLLQAARELSITKFINTSTSEVYGTAEYVPINEKHPLKGQSPYSASKIGADQLVYSFYNSFDLPALTVRPFNTYGPRQSARAIIPTIITQISSGQSEIKLGAKKPTRDFSFVKDTVRGFISALESPDILGETINLGSGFEISMEQTAHLIAEIMKKDINFIEDFTRIRPKKSEVERLWADNSKAKQVLNWRPEYADKDGFRSGLIETIDWFIQPENLKKYKSGIYNV
jgi:NAD dependent epimerase/dehydratase